MKKVLMLAAAAAMAGAASSAIAQTAAPAPTDPAAAAKPPAEAAPQTPAPAAQATAQPAKPAAAATGSQANTSATTPGLGVGATVKDNTGAAIGQITDIRTDPDGKQVAVVRMGADSFSVESDRLAVQDGAAVINATQAQIRSMVRRR